MGYPIDLDEYTDVTITKEYFRRRECEELNRCYYCGQQLDNNKACKIQSHKNDK